MTWLMPAMSKPEIGLSMLYCLGKPFDEMVKEIPNVSTYHVELIDDGFHALDKRRVQKLNVIRASYGKKFTVHAPFVGVNLALPPDSLLKAIVRRLKDSIVNTEALGCDVWVFHPGLTTATSMFYPGMDWTRNIENVRVIFKFAEDMGVTACIENIMQGFVMKNVEEFRRFYDEVDENIGFAFDTGHANVVGQVEEFLTEFSTKIAHVHAHDNHGKSDEHLGIGFGTIDWNKVANHLKNASFNKVLMIESVEHIEESIKRLKNLFS
jgi:sugar phosphate isomerase/epimerase